MRQLNVARRAHNVLKKFVIAFEESKSELSRGLYFIEIFHHLRRREKRFRQGPFKWIVPKISRQAAEGLFDNGRAAQHVLAARQGGCGGAFRFRPAIQIVRRSPGDQFARALVNFLELLVETLDDLSHPE